MKNLENIDSEKFYMDVKSFNIVRAITDSNFFEKVDISPTARLIMFNLANMYNPKSGYVFPKNKKLEKCTGCKTRSVISAINELKDKGLILILQDEGRRNIYFTRKTYELLGFISEEKLAQEDAKNTPDNAKNTQESANFAPTCIEQKKEHFKKHSEFKNFKSESNCQNYEKIKKYLFNDSFLTDKQRAEIVLNGYHRYNIRSNEDLKCILMIQEFWNSSEKDFPILAEIQTQCLNNDIFGRKIANFREEIKDCFAKHSRQVEVIRKSWGC